MTDFTLTNPLPPDDEKPIAQFGLDFDFDPAPQIEAQETRRECETCWKWQECDLRKSGAKGCGELFY